MPQILSWASLALVPLVPVANALKEQVVSSFVYTRHGDRTPLYSTDTSVLTPYGAQQMYTAGSRFRERYLGSSFNNPADSTTIRDISLYLLNTAEIDILTTSQQFTGASAQAFMQALYPPLAGDANLNYTQVAGISDLANGTNVVAPLNGYQYPEINSASSNDLNSIWVNGAVNCPAYMGRMREYYGTEDFDFFNTSSWDFYQYLEETYLENTFFDRDLGYSDAYQMYDYLQYQYLHNRTFRDSISEVNMTKAKLLAADWVYALYSNASDPVKSIAGRTLANALQNTFQNAIQTQGQTHKLKLLFGDFEPMASFVALSRLSTENYPEFYNILPMGSSFVFELFSLLPDDDPATSFPNHSDLRVRFLYQNGTGSDFKPIPLFGHGPGVDDMPYAEFVDSLSRFTLNGVREWCEICSAYSVFCRAFTGDDDSPLGGSGRGSRLSPAVAGVVGALVALAVAGILFGLLMAFAGFRVHRQGGRKKSEVAGFKGSQKLASDQDLTLPKGGAAAIVSEPEAAKGHERVGSWELREQAKREEAGHMGAVNMSRPRRPSYEDDDIQVNPYAPAVKPHDHV